MIPAQDALQRLRDGNARFAQDRSQGGLADPDRRAALARSQHPIAIVLGCSDSRVPAELVFDQPLGDLFVIRVAGNVVGPSQIDSVEFAAAQFGCRLAVVLGHSRCGAVSATLAEIQGPATGGYSAIVSRVRPALEPLLADGAGQDAEALLAAAVRTHVQASTTALRQGSSGIERLIAAGNLTVVGAEYSLDTGLVDFLDGCPE
ncbi:MAG: carbonic anhydrase [Planctomycetota bacterium]